MRLWQCTLKSFKDQSINEFRGFVSLAAELVARQGHDLRKANDRRVINFDHVISYQIAVPR